MVHFWAPVREAPRSEISLGGSLEFKDGRNELSPKEVGQVGECLRVGGTREDRLSTSRSSLLLPEHLGPFFSFFFFARLVLRYYFSVAAYDSFGLKQPRCFITQQFL